MPWFKKYGFLLVYLLIPLPLIGFYLGGMFNFITFIVLFTLIPLVDYFVKDSLNPSIEQKKTLVKQTYFQWITIAYVPIQIVILGLSVWLIHYYPLSIVEWLGFTCSTGFVTGGVSINIAHELMHKHSRLQHIASKILLSMFCYGHFFIEHVRGHHVLVATPGDPASARLGESLYSFLPRTIAGSFRSAWNIEQRRLKRNHWSLFSRHNQFWWIFGVPFSLVLGLYLFGGMNVVMFFLLQAFTAILTLEIINYIEHYGLQRKKLNNGQYEKVTPMHSWNANHWFSNMILFQLQRHSDHHSNGGKPYQILMHMKESPQLPSGYLGMIVLAIIPPLWRRIMDPRVKAHKNTLIEDANSEPPIIETEKQAQ